MINSIAKITLYVENQDEAKRFWTEKMGFQVRLEQQMGPDMKWLEVGPDRESTAVFVLYERKLMEAQNGEVNTGHPSVILSASDLKGTHERLVNNGVRVEDIVKMPYGSMFTFYDMDGNRFLLREDL